MACLFRCLANHTEASLLQRAMCVASVILTAICLSIFLVVRFFSFSEVSVLAFESDSTKHCIPVDVLE